MIGENANKSKRNKKGRGEGRNQSITLKKPIAFQTSFDCVTRGFNQPFFFLFLFSFYHCHLYLESLEELVKWSLDLDQEVVDRVAFALRHNI